MSKTGLQSVTQSISNFQSVINMSHMWDIKKEKKKLSMTSVCRMSNGDLQGDPRGKTRVN